MGNPKHYFPIFDNQIQPNCMLSWDCGNICSNVQFPYLWGVYNSHIKVQSFSFGAFKGTGNNDIQ